MRPASSLGTSARTQLRLVPPLDRQVPPSLSLAVGDLVVYALHGIGRIEATAPAEGSLPERITLVFESGLRVTLPLARAHDALRCLSGEAELEEVERTLRADVPPSLETWSRRHRLAQEKLAAGRIDELAEIVRDGLHRQRLLARGHGGRTAAPSESELYRHARRLLAAEIAACRGIETETADAWILQQVSGP